MDRRLEHKFERSVRESRPWIITLAESPVAHEMGSQVRVPFIFPTSTRGFFSLEAALQGAFLAPRIATSIKLCNSEGGIYE